MYAAPGRLLGTPKEVMKVDNKRKIKVSGLDVYVTIANADNLISKNVALCLDTAILEPSDLMIAIVTSRAFSNIQQRVITPLREIGADLSKVYCLAAEGAQCLHYKNGVWEEDWSYVLSDEQKADIQEKLLEAMRQVNLLPKSRDLSNHFDDRGGMITLSMLGKDASKQAKAEFDPRGFKRSKICDAFRALPGSEAYGLTPGGRTSIDVRLKGQDKGTALCELAEMMGLNLKQVVHFGDGFDKGNDYPVLKAGITGINVTGGPEHFITLFNALYDGIC